MIISRQIPDKDALDLPKGVWLDEDDFVLWICAETGYECFLIRNDFTFTLCGYVGLPANHPLHGLHYHDPLFTEHTLGKGIQVHGGLTYAGTYQPQPLYFGDNLPKSTWAFGFDTAHSHDFPPLLSQHMKRMGMQELSFFRKDNYRTIEYVKKEVLLLAKQLRAADIDIQPFLKIATHQKENK